MIDTTLCHIEKDGKWLMLYRNKKENDLNEGKWVGIGGKLEPGETADACNLREVYEETGLKLLDARPQGVVHFRSDKWEDEEMYLYTASEFEGELTEDCDEGRLEWIPKEEILNLNLWAGDRLFIEPLLNGEEHIALTVCYEGEKLASWSYD